VPVSGDDLLRWRSGRPNDALDCVALDEFQACRPSAGGRSHLQKREAGVLRSAPEALGGRPERKRVGACDDARFPHEALTNGAVPGPGGARGAREGPCL